MFSLICGIKTFFFKRMKVKGRLLGKRKGTRGGGAREDGSKR
jgi:hypothetical protein